MKIFSIDPGPKLSAWCEFDGDTIRADISDNHELITLLRDPCFETPIAIEMIASYGMGVGKEVFDTCVWIGRFIEASRKEPIQIYRREVKLHVCQSPKANDSNIRYALIDRFGAPGTKKAPGKTYGLKKDMWAALGIAVTAYDRMNEDVTKRLEEGK